MNTTITMTTRQAQAEGYRALTLPYELPKEQAMLDNVLADLRRGQVAHALVRRRAGLVVWRRAPGWRPAVLPAVRRGSARKVRAASTKGGRRT